MSNLGETGNIHVHICTASGSFNYFTWFLTYSVSRNCPAAQFSGTFILINQEQEHRHFSVSVNVRAKCVLTWSEGS